MRAWARVKAWTFAVAVLALGLAIVEHADPLPRMLVIVTALFVGMKVVVLAERRLETGRALDARRTVAFFGWVGMRPGDFAARHADLRSLDARPGLWSVAAGAGLLGVARWAVTSWPMIAAALALPALSLIVHFGLLRLLAAFWRSRGFDVAPPFEAPWRATSLRDFWSRRWNRAFSEMAGLVAYRPVAGPFGASAGRLAAFVLSGLLHELAISVPVRAGYGGPLLYFLLHGVLVASEPPARSRVWTLACVVLPLPLLFHAPFLRGVVLPLLR